MYKSYFYIYNDDTPDMFHWHCFQGPINSILLPLCKEKLEYIIEGSYSISLDSIPDNDMYIDSLYLYIHFTDRLYVFYDKLHEHYAELSFKEILPLIKNLL